MGMASAAAELAADGCAHAQVRMPFSCVAATHPLSLWVAVLGSKGGEREAHLLHIFHRQLGEVPGRQATQRVPEACKVCTQRRPRPRRGHAPLEPPPLRRQQRRCLRGVEVAGASEEE